MIAPGLVAVIGPVAVGFLLGPAALGGMLAGATVVGIAIALMMANAGGAGIMPKNILSKAWSRVKAKAVFLTKQQS